MKRIFFISIILLLVLISKTFAQVNYSLVNDKDFLINGKLDFFSKQADFLKVFGKPTKIENFEPECGSYAAYAEERPKGLKFYIYFKGQIKYIIFDKKADFDEVNFLKDTTTFVTYKKIKISSKTTIKVLEKKFPKSFKEFKIEKSNIFRLKFDTQDCDDQIQFEIKNGKVVSMNYWTPC